ncbi:DMT family transporter [Granulosicoccus antarcticus]|uniref:Putative cystine transporter YijE n=1 Tax=Granulosicoccus antarcticus IMCC3135 TaxID=1192854 RepID=A0A2Z2NUS4_9GAMM|nr:EamA family transporter [Granulosicoccus antarcticus]ASJ75312.1 putative cystine transporter YijE [Granulosicoccus antarcticus IMCC3135]
MSLHNWLMLLVLSLLWGGSFFFVGVAVSALPPLSIVFLRVAMAALILWLVVILLRVPLPGSRSGWLALLVMGVLNNVIPFSLIVWGQTQIDSGLASILNATTPLFGVVLAGLLLSDERMTRLKVTGVVIGFIGTVWMIGPGALQGLGGDTLAQLAIMGAAISYGFASVFGRRFKRMQIDPVMAATGQVTLSAVILLPLVLIVDQPWTLESPPMSVWFSMAALAVFSTALAYILYFRILASAGASNLLLVTFLVPVSAIFLGYFFLDERLATSHFIGMALIGLGLSAIDGRLWRRRQ